MSEPSPTPQPARVPDDATGGASDLRSLAIVGYVLFLLAWVNGLTGIIGVVIAYVKRKDATGTIWRSHFDNMITVFWVMVLGAVLGMLSWPFWLAGVFTHSWVFLWPPVFTLPFVFAFLIFPVLVVWYFYRTIRGLIRASDERAY
jgi:uncharacterized membrane protein